MNKKMLLIVALLSVSVATVGVILGMGSEKEGSPACVARTKEVAKSEAVLTTAEKKLTETEATLKYLVQTKAAKGQIDEARHAVEIAKDKVRDSKAAVERNRTIAGAHCPVE